VDLETERLTADARSDHHWGAPSKHFPSGEGSVRGTNFLIFVGGNGAF